MQTARPVKMSLDIRIGLGQNRNVLKGCVEQNKGYFSFNLDWTLPCFLLFHHSTGLDNPNTAVTVISDTLGTKVLYLSVPFLAFCLLFIASFQCCDVVHVHWHERRLWP